MKISTAARAAFVALHQFDPSEAAGLRQLTHPRSAPGILVAVYHAVESGIDESGFVTVCETHSRCVVHPTLELARGHAAEPAGWCGVCSGQEPADELDDDGEYVGPGSKVCHTCGADIEPHAAYCPACIEKQLQEQGGDELAGFDEYHQFADAHLEVSR